MKKSLIFLGLLALTLVVAGCSLYGSAGTPSELTGTWSGETKVLASTQDSITGSYAGTWTYARTVPSTPVAQWDSSVASSVTYISVPANDSVTYKWNESRVIAADGSFTDTYTYDKVTAARDALTSTTTTQYVSGTTPLATVPAVTAAEDKYVLTTTVTVTQQADKNYYIEKVVQTQVYTQVRGSTTTTTTTSATTYAYNLASSLSYKAAVQDISSNYSQTTLGTPVAVGATVSGVSYWTQAGTVSSSIYGGKSMITDKTYSIVIGSDGTYTATTVTTITNETDTTFSQKVTQVDAGTVIGNVDTTTKYLTLNRTSSKLTYLGAGTGISLAFPATAATATLAPMDSATSTYYITKGSSATYFVGGIFAGTLTLKK